MTSQTLCVVDCQHPHRPASRRDPAEALRSARPRYLGAGGTLWILDKMVADDILSAPGAEGALDPLAMKGREEWLALRLLNMSGRGRPRTCVDGGGYFWPMWTLLGWGIGLAFHGWGVYFGDRRPTEAQIEREMNRRKG